VKITNALNDAPSVRVPERLRRKIPAYLFGDAPYMADAFSPEPFVLTVQVPESFRGGCSFGAGKPGLSHQEIQGMPIIERQVQQP
tara:strand:- start:8598 stop:8852 length:255 start_codon:yes stop_codon:yes gene_type:complete